MKKKVAVLMGGMSTEREVSLNSGKSVLAALDRDKYEVHEVILNDKKHVTINISITNGSRYWLIFMIKFLKSEISKMIL